MKFCENCGAEHEGTYGSGRFCSLKCSRAFSTKAKRKEINEKVSKQLKGEVGSRGGQPLREFECIECGSKFLVRKHYASFCSKKCLRSHSNKKGWNPSQYEIDWSTIHKKAYANGNNYVAGGTTKWIEIDTSIGKVKVQGSYEVRACKILDKMKQCNEIQDWRYNISRVEYEIDGKCRTYIVDFTVIDSDGFFFIEVKGRKKREDDFKWEAARRISKLEVWTLKDIKEKEMKFD